MSEDLKSNMNSFMEYISSIPCSFGLTADKVDKYLRGYIMLKEPKTNIQVQA
jgi:hypothetical protein